MLPFDLKLLVVLLGVTLLGVPAAVALASARVAAHPAARPTPVTPGDLPAPVPPAAAPTLAVPAAPPPPGHASFLPPELPPNSAADVVSVIADSSGCAPGSACTITVEAVLQPTSTRRPVSWTLTSIDSCSGATVKLATSTVVAEPGWTRVVGYSTVTLPPSAAQMLVAVTEAPARASSPLVRVGAEGCA